MTRFPYFMVCLTVALLSPALQALAQPTLDQLEQSLNGAVPPKAVPSEPAPAPAAVGKPGVQVDIVDGSPTPLPNSKPALTVVGGGEPGYFGATCDDNATRGRGVVVLAVRAGGPAEAAGIKPGDRLVLVNHRTLAKLDDMAEALASTSPGTKVEVEISRGGQRQIFHVTLGSRPVATAQQPIVTLVQPPEERAMLGLHVAAMSDALRQRFGITIRSGVVIDGVTADSPAERSGLPLGGVIVAMNGSRIDAPEQLRDFLAGAKPGDEVDISYYQGGDLQRKRVRLAGQRVMGATDPGPRVESRTDRPLLRALEQAIGPGKDARQTAQITSEIELLYAQMQKLQQQNEALQRRVAELEAQLTGKKLDAASR